MSNKATQENKSRPHPESTQQALRQTRDDLELIAGSDLPAAWVADALLDVADNVDIDQDTADGSGGDTDR